MTADDRIEAGDHAKPGSFPGNLVVHSGRSQLSLQPFERITNNNGKNTNTNHTNDNTSNNNNDRRNNDQRAQDKHG